MLFHINRKKLKKNKSYRLYFTLRYFFHTSKSKLFGKEKVDKKVFDERIFSIYETTIFFKIWVYYAILVNEGLFEFIFWIRKTNIESLRIDTFKTINTSVSKKKIYEGEYILNSENYYKKGLITSVIPTLNAGLNLKFLLKSLRDQKTEIKKILIVDSGSTDETLKIAKKFNCEIIKIDKKNFSHSGTRNFALNYVDTPFVYFTVQDCVLGSNFTLNVMQDIMISNDLSAVTNPQNPRMDSDEYSCITTFFHNKVFYDFPYNHFKIFETLGSKEMQRYHTQLDNVSCLYLTEDLRQNKFRGEFAEDVNIACDLIKNGKKVSRANIYPVIHSHTRSWLYHFKRSYVESKAFEHTERKFDLNIENQDALFTLKYFYYFLCQLKLYKLKDLSFVFENIVNGKFKLFYFISLIRTSIRQYIFFYQFRKKILKKNLLKILIGVVISEKLSNHLSEEHLIIKRKLGENV